MKDKKASMGSLKKEMDNISKEHDGIINSAKTMMDNFDFFENDSSKSKPEQNRTSQKWD